MEKNDVIHKYNFILDKYKELFYNCLLQKYSPDTLKNMNLTDYIFKLGELYPNERKAFNMLRHLYIDSNDELTLRTYDLMNLYDYMKGVIGNDN